MCGLDFTSATCLNSPYTLARYLRILRNVIIDSTSHSSCAWVAWKTKSDRPQLHLGRPHIISVSMAFHGEHWRITKSNKIDAPCKDLKGTSLIYPPHITANTFSCLEDSGHFLIQIQSIHKSSIRADLDDEMGSVAAVWPTVITLYSHVYTKIVAASGPLCPPNRVARGAI